MVFFVCVVGGFLYGLHRPELRVQHVSVETQGRASGDVIEAIIRDTLHGSYVWLIPKNSIFFIPKQTLVDELKKTFPSIASVSLEKRGATIFVQVFERDPVALWCGDVVPTGESENVYLESGTEGCFEIDGEGFIFSEARDTARELPRLYGSLAHANPLGQYFVSKDDFVQLQNTYGALSSRGVKGILVVDEKDIEVWLKDGVRILAERNTSPEKIRQYISALAEKDLLTSSSSVRIDMRFGEKVYLRR
jgi:cell division septal protein FtsQ